MKVFRSVFILLFVSIILHSFSINSTQAQKLKLSKERKVELDSIKDTQQKLWLEEIEQSRRPNGDGVLRAVKAG